MIFIFLPSKYVTYGWHRAYCYHYFEETPKTFLYHRCLKTSRYGIVLEHDYFLILSLFYALHFFFVTTNTSPQRLLSNEEPVSSTISNWVAITTLCRTDLSKSSTVQYEPLCLAAFNIPTNVLYSVLRSEAIFTIKHCDTSDMFSHGRPI